MFARLAQRAFSVSARSSANLLGVASSEATSMTTTGRIGRCLRKSLLRNFPEDDLLSCFDNMSIQKRYLGTSAMKTTPVVPQLQVSADDYEVDPELVTRYVVRPSEIDDCGDILKLVRGLAEWEGTIDQVEITEEDLKKDGFGSNPCYQCVLLEAFEDDGDHSVIGYAMFSGGYCAWKGRTITWEDLFIHHDYRAKGLGAVLLHEVCKMGYLDGCKYISGYVDIENDRAKQWYEDIGFENQTQKHGYNIMSMAGNSLQHYVTDHKPIEKLGRRGVHVSSLVTN
ncbi:diamine acetyltransferase 2 [Strongylocentrotus purpuratus]|uniref:N-acetyltransferase domain-containing protein n=1 Tax=Strongylocentrotus purpuratus TaxID=7668 RepID=A0A7M7NN35_STRPU|nr:diamine acetyltransferase 2-like isoform X1 [Strongylocentrotus purpuratus]XP_030838933.1 diamine acetyltransferase 2-like isoform X2 [Strongylocentrotus purpuratus]XP_030838934.1 diamine acetyltransferase 2-like isoform X2 [Strongylocentrotus purpuratus]XP_798072.1 diamine acetyltransferase 2 [Strongylocentrotus purpuratus]|eukprot:XP_798072.1 PREDICTED: diamine acetyltransferase 2 [Strongylocentrotus purpuratus]